MAVSDERMKVISAAIMAAEGAYAYHIVEKGHVYAYQRAAHSFWSHLDSPLGEHRFTLAEVNILRDLWKTTMAKEQGPPIITEDIFNR